MEYLMGIDIGTSSLKVLIIDIDGRQIATAKESYNIISEKTGYAEQSAEIWWNACINGVKSAIASGKISADDIYAVGFSGQMHGLVAIDKNGKPVKNAIIHCDTRSQEQVKLLEKTVKKDNCNNPYTGYLLTSLLWLKDNEPETYSNIFKVMLPKDYLRFRLTGEIFTDYSDASGSFAFDIDNGKWDKQLLGSFNIPVSIFPEVINCTELAGEITKEVSKYTGLSQNTKIVCGGGDLVMQAVGNGAIDNTVATINLGSSGQVAFCSDKIIKTGQGTNIFYGIDSKSFYNVGAIMSAGLSVEWIKNIVGNELSILNEPSGLLFLPYLNGERTPHVNPNLSSMFLGLTANTTKAHINTSVLEGVSYALYECINIFKNAGIKSDKIILSGGGANIKEWRQIIANIVNCPLYTTENNEQAALGAAIIAGTGAGIFKTIKNACESIINYSDEVITPNCEKHMRYMYYYELYKQTYQNNKEILEKLKNN